MIPENGILMSICDRNMNARVTGLTVVEARTYVAQLKAKGIQAFVGPDQPSRPPQRLDRTNPIGGAR